MGVQLKLWAWVFSSVRVSLQSSNKTLVRLTYVSEYHSGYKACATVCENPKTQWEERERTPQPNAGALTSRG